MIVKPFAEQPSYLAVVLRIDDIKPHDITVQLCNTSTAKRIRGWRRVWYSEFRLKAVKPVMRGANWYEYRLPMNVDGRRLGLLPWCEVLSFDKIVPQVGLEWRRAD